MDKASCECLLSKSKDNISHWFNGKNKPIQ